MKISSYATFYNNVFTLNLEEAASSAAALGADGVELLDISPRTGDALFQRFTPDNFSVALNKHGLEVSCYSVGACLYTSDEKTAISSLFSHIDFASKLGSPFFHHTFTLGLDATPSTLPYADVLHRILPLAEKIADRCNAHGMVCLYEPQGYYFNGIEGIEKLYCEMKTRGYNVGICADTGNPLFVDCAPDAFIDHFKNEIRHVHVKDYVTSLVPLGIHGDIQKSTSGIYLYDTPLGSGNVNVKKCLSLLKATNYNGYISLEGLPDSAIESADRDYVINTLNK